MNKFYLLGALTAVAASITSCANQDVVNEGDARQTNAISFGTSLAKNTNGSRALNSLSDLNKFFVYAAKDSTSIIFEHQEVNKTTDWSYTASTKPKWEPGSSYVFYGYSADNGELKGTAKYSITKGLTFESVYVGTPGANYDLVYAGPITQVGKMTGNSRVSMRFRHILSQIKLSFKNATANATNVPYNVYVNWAMVDGHELTGDFNGEEWTFKNYSDTIPGAGYTYLDFTKDVKTSGAIALDSISTTLPLHVIPQTDYNGSMVSIRFNVTITNANDSTDTVTKTLQANFLPDWKLGYRYNYIIPISLYTIEDIEFTAESLNDWVDGANGNLEVFEVTE